MSKNTLCGCPVWFNPPGGGFGPGCDLDFVGDFKTPVCASGPQPEPPFQGLFELDFRDGPLAQSFPDTAAGLAAALGIPAALADNIVLFNESAGNTAYDQVGTAHLTRQNDALIGQIGSGISDGAGGILATRRVAEANHLSTNGNLQCVSTTAYNIGLNEDFALLFVARVPYYGSANNEDLIFSKATPGANPTGYWLNIDSNAAWFFDLYFDNGAHNNVRLNYTLADGAWRAGILHYDAAAHVLYAATNWYLDSGPVVGDELTIVNPFTCGGTWADGSTGGAQVQFAYLAKFSGAAAAALGNGDAAIAAFETAHLDPNGHMGEVTSLGGGARYQQATIVGDDPVRGIQIHDWGYPQYPYAYRAPFSHSSKLGMAFRRVFTTQHVLYTDTLDDASWVATNLTVSAAYADLDESPRNLHEARKLTATADNGYLETNPTTTASDWDFGCFVKRHSSMVSDVPGRLILWNAGTGAEIAGIDFVATSKWQHVSFPATSVGANDRIRIRIDSSGDSLAVSRVYSSGLNNNNFNFCANAQFEDNERPKYIRGASALPETWIHADQGEILVSFVIDAPLDQPYGRATRSIVQFWDGAGATDRHVLQFTLGQAIRYTVWDNVGASQTFDSAVIADPTAEIVVRARWNHASAVFGGGRYSELIVNGVTTPGFPNPWNINGGVLDTCDLGNNYNADYVNGVIALVRVWASPQ